MRPITTLALLAATVVTLGAAEEVSIDLDEADTFRPYQLATCLVSGEKIGSMGDGRSIVVGDQEVTVCCKGCFKKLAAKPERYLTKMKRLEAAAKQAEQEQQAEATDEGAAKQGDHAGHGHGDSHKGHNH